MIFRVMLQWVLFDYFYCWIQVNHSKKNAVTLNEFFLLSALGSPETAVLLVLTGLHHLSSISDVSIILPQCTKQGYYASDWNAFLCTFGNPGSRAFLGPRFSPSSRNV